MMAQSPHAQDSAVTDAVSRIRALIPIAGEGYPVSTRDGRWQIDPKGTWTAGFWPGQLWLAHLLTGEDGFAAAAAAQCDLLARNHLGDETHDLGMLFYPSLVRGWQITGRDDFRQLALQAAQRLAARFNPAGRFIRAIGAMETTEQDGYVIVDTLMNLPLLSWASRETGERRFGELALAHALTSRERHVRADGSTAQVFNFDASTGAALGAGAHQGISATSCWSRGQAWALHGFAAAYGWSGEPLLLETAHAVAHWWIAHRPRGQVPRWDFDARRGDPLDSSASAIAICGLFALARISGIASYAAYADRALSVLIETCAAHHPAQQGLLLHGTGFKPKGRDIDVSLAYGDYFYLAALLRRSAPATFAKHFDIGSI
jgi:unsaturated chondroitin disaccharide hydrolase